MALKLHGYWRSTAAYRVRIALNLKGLDYSNSPVDLRGGQQQSAAYLAVNPQGLVPALETDDGVLIQSLAIIEWLEETFPEPALLPVDPAGRARARALAAIVGGDIHPLNNLRVLKRLRGPLRAGEEDVNSWISEWITRGFTAIEARMGDGAWCEGDAPGLADCFLIPQVYSARRFNVSLEAFPRIQAVCELAAGHPAFVAAEPERQADAPY
jgi:maleylpyruvate isomerase